MTPVCAVHTLTAMNEPPRIDVKRLRRALKFSQAEFSARIGVDQATVSRWETGASQPSGPALRLLQSLRDGPSPVPKQTTAVDIFPPLATDRDAAWRELLAFMNAGWCSSGRPLTREDLHER